MLSRSSRRIHARSAWLILAQALWIRVHDLGWSSHGRPPPLREGPSSGAPPQALQRLQEGPPGLVLLQAGAVLLLLLDDAALHAAEAGLPSAGPADAGCGQGLGELLHHQRQQMGGQRVRAGRHGEPRHEGEDEETQSGGGRRANGDDFKIERIWAAASRISGQLVQTPASGRVAADGGDAVWLFAVLQPQNRERSASECERGWTPEDRRAPLYIRLSDPLVSSFGHPSAYRTPLSSYSLSDDTFP